MGFPSAQCVIVCSFICVGLRESLLDYAKPHRIQFQLMAEKLNSEALEFFRRAGKRGGKKRLKTMTDQERKDSARTAANARWKKKDAK
jgi:hypothetical protein